MDYIELNIKTKFEVGGVAYPVTINFDYQLDIEVAELKDIGYPEGLHTLIVKSLAKSAGLYGVTSAECLPDIKAEYQHQIEIAEEVRCGIG